MDPFRAYYEYPSSQAAIHAIPSRNAYNNVSNTKSKRSWGNLLRIPGRNKKDREVSPVPSGRSSTVYAPGLNLSPGTSYVSPAYSYAYQQNHFITSTPYRDVGNNYSTNHRSQYVNYSSTYGKSSINPVAHLYTSSSEFSSNETIKNTVKYTDWFGSVVAKKSPVRPSLPMTQSSAVFPGENGVATVSSWDNYVSIQTPQIAIEFPSILPIPNYGNICMCPDQLFSTKSRKKKKCKKCGRKFGTIKNATAIGSVTRIRPTIPANLYQAPTIWAWPQPTKSQYAQPCVISPQNNLPAIEGSEKESDSPPLTPETIRSARSSGSNSTLKPETPSNQKTIPPPPTVPLPSIPKYNSETKLSIIGRTNTAYELLANENVCVSSDTDDLSDNAVHDAAKIKKSNNKNKENNESDQRRVSVISIGGNNSISGTNVNDIKIVSASDNAKVKIYTDTSDKVIINNSFGKSSKVDNSPLKINSGTIKVNAKEINNKDKNKQGTFKYDWNHSLQTAKQTINNKIYSSRYSSSNNNNTSKTFSYNSSQVKRKNKYNNVIRDKTKDRSLTSYVMPDRDNSKVLSIAGQRILFDQGHLSKNKKSNKMENESEREKAASPEIGEWEPMNDNFQKINAETEEEKENQNNNYNESSLNNLENNKETNDYPIEDSTRTSYFKPIENKWSIRSPDIVDTIHEEEEDKEQDSDNKFNNFSDAIMKSEEDFSLNEDKDTSSSSAGSPVREECIRPTLSELLQVKSILKRPNSIDTSSETDSDLYLQTVSETRQNFRKKKSVQFRQSNEINLVEDVLETKGRKVSSIKNVRKERNGKLNSINNDIDNSLFNANEIKQLTDKYISNWDFMDRKNTPKENGFDGTESCEDQISGCDLDRGLTEHTETNSLIIKESEGPTINLRRSHSHRETNDDANVPTFSDTFRLRQLTTRPTILTLDDKRTPSRRAPPLPRKSTSPVRPTVPPPPPPPTNSTDKSKGNNKIMDNSYKNDVSAYNPSSLYLTPLVPPLPSSSPPPLPSSSPPPLDDDEELSSPEITFNSFKDTASSVSISSKMLQITPSIQDLSNHQVCESLPSSTNTSVFSSNVCEEIPTATIRGRVKSSSHLSPFRSLNDYTSEALNNNSNYKSSIQNPNHRVSFLNSMVGSENEGHYSEHIYEELPSLPSSPTHSNPNTPSPQRSMFDGASKYEILEYLKDARNRVNIAVDENDDIINLNHITEQLEQIGLEDDEGNGLDTQDDSLIPSRYMDERSSNRSSNSSEFSENSGPIRSDKERLAAGEIERTDSGVGSETSKPTVSIRRLGRNNTSSSTPTGNYSGFKEGDLPPCDDCDSPVEAKVTNSGLMYAPLVCRRCSRRRQERKEILSEIMETETKYGRDLKVMVEQFNRPMRVAGLLSKSQLDRIFLNIEELMEHNRNFSLQMKDAYEIALEQGDEDLLTVNVAKLFLNADSMLHAFQNYCVRQGAASILLQNLEKEKELLRIFLKVSQMENTLLRRMNLHSFLMVPVQRVTKYPLLLARLYKATPPSHSSREDCRRAREKIEIYLQHINNETKETSPTKLWRRISMSVGNTPPSIKYPLTPPQYDTSIKIRTVALEVLDWNPDEAYIVREGRLLCLPPESNNWTRRGRGFKMVAVQIVLVTLGKPRTTLEEEISEDGLITPRNLGIKEAAILAFKDHRLTKTAMIRDPWILSRVVVTWDAEGETECFELTDLATKETYIFKDRECVATEEWFRSIQFHALSVGSWRRRRPALANIMINGARGQ